MTLEDLLNLAASQTGAIANVEVLDAGFHEVPSLKLGPRHHYHHGSYCHFAKVNGNQAACHANKRRSARRAMRAHRAEPFYGCCPFGVWDYAQPVHVDQQCVAVIYLGHFRADRSLAPMHGQCYTGPALTPITRNRLAAIKRHARFIREFIVYAYQNARRLGATDRRRMPPSHYQRQCEQFIQDHYHQPIRLADLADMLGVNANYLGQVIKTHCGRSFRQLLNDYRVRQAQVHLRSERLSVTTIAYACGFQDSNYFTCTFHRLTGRTPTTYRREMKADPA